MEGRSRGGRGVIQKKNEVIQKKMIHEHMKSKIVTQFTLTIILDFISLVDSLQ